MNKYIDIHAHILPGMGCGPATVEASLRMLQQLCEHGVKTVVATPLFDARRESVPQFMERRRIAVETLQAAIGEESALPNVVVGAELALCPALLHCKTLSQLRVADTEYVMVQLEEGQTISEELLSLFDHFRIASRLIPVITNIDCLFQSINVQDMYTLAEAGALLQVSCGGIMSHETRKYALYLLGNHIAQFVSSGFSDPDGSPQITEAMRVMKRSLPLEKYKRIKNNAGMLVSNAAMSELIS